MPRHPGPSGASGAAAPKIAVVDQAGAIALVVAVVAVALWGLFRRGSMSDRARPGAEAMDQAEPEPDEPVRHEPEADEHT